MLVEEKVKPDIIECGVIVDFMQKDGMPVNGELFGVCNLQFIVCNNLILPRTIYSSVLSVFCINRPLDLQRVHLIIHQDLPWDNTIKGKVKNHYYNI